eukprot:GHUV01014666.1.p1 GENE.GHUV01014666.1~~GHUV01014666.1.p1  ORF type:complete len:381 (+),score=79.70 GHUV01014666.1:623-1765(+)
MVFCANVANHRVLSGALGASAGVMTYVSFVEIFSTKAVTSFVEAGLSDTEATRYATFAFFTGVIATWLLGKLTHGLTLLSSHIRRCKTQSPSAKLSQDHQQVLKSSALATPPQGAEEAKATAAAARAGATAADLEQGAPAPSPSTSSTPDADVITKDLARDGVRVVVAEPPVAETTMDRPAACNTSSNGLTVDWCDCCTNNGHVTSLKIPKEESPEMVAVLQADHHTTDLARMGLLTGLAVALHNLPEGFATFVATLASPSAGIAIAVAIALHNIPEGIVVAMPVYYATKSRWKGFFWSFLSGVAEPVGGLLAYVILASNGMSPLAFAVMFAFVAGMMVYISLRELLPMALRYDPQDMYATSACFWGMVVMAASLLLFKA